MYYNFCRVHQTLRVTPAMAGGVRDHLWGIEEIVELPPMSQVGSALERLQIVFFGVVGIALIGAGLVGYDFLGDRNVAIDQQPTWVSPPVWSELIFGVPALIYALYMLKKVRHDSN